VQKVEKFGERVKEIMNLKVKKWFYEKLKF